MSATIYPWTPGTPEAALPLGSFLYGWDASIKCVGVLAVCAQGVSVTAYPLLCVCLRDLAPTFPPFEATPSTCEAFRVNDNPFYRVGLFIFNLLLQAQGDLFGRVLE